MSVPIRLVVCTHNIWASSRWPERKDALTQFLGLHRPDILCVQELRPETHSVIDSVLEDHQYVDNAFEGWKHEGNVYWNRDLFDLAGSGAEDIGMFEKARRLFWVRLRVKGRDDTLFVSTAHYTWAGNAQEKEGGVNPRYAQAQKTVEALDALVPVGEACLFMGDLNDYQHPLRILREGGLTDSFAALGRIPPPTIPAIPMAKGTPQVIDWMLHRGPIHPMATEVVDFYVDDIAPSDHKPVITTYRLG